MRARSMRVWDGVHIVLHRVRDGHRALMGWRVSTVMVDIMMGIVGVLLRRWGTDGGAARESADWGGRLLWLGHERQCVNGMRHVRGGAPVCNCRTQKICCLSVAAVSHLIYRFPNLSNGARPVRCSPLLFSLSLPKITTLCVCLTFASIVIGLWALTHSTLTGIRYDDPLSTTAHSPLQPSK
jgi:hypothetical protein